MRFSEFKRLQENTPAVTSRDLKSLGPAALKMTADVGKNIKGKIDAALGKKPDPTATKVQVPPGLQQQTQPQPSAIQQAQKQAAQQQAQVKNKLPPIPAVGSQLVLPDIDTKKPGSFTIKKAGPEVTLEPVKQTPNSPKVNVIVKQKDLQNTIAALDPNNKVGTIK